MKRLASQLTAYGWLQWRWLQSHRTALLILLLLFSAAWLASQGASPSRSVCYIVYWEEGPWIEHLRASPPQETMPVEIRHVREFTNARGVIVYPPHAHSIQLRPPAVADEPWRVWYWYAGSDPAVLEPVMRWFWSRSQSYWQTKWPLEVMVSPLQSTHAVGRAAEQSLGQWMSGRGFPAGIMLVCLVFCGGYLPLMCLVEQRASGTLLLLCSKPGGSRRWALATAGCASVLVIAVSLPLWCTAAFTLSQAAIVLLMLAFYAGLIVCIAAGTRTVTGAASTLMLYGGISVALAFLPGLCPIFSLESQCFLWLRDGEGVPWWWFGAWVAGIATCAQRMLRSADWSR